MQLLIQSKELLELMKYFHTLTGIVLTFFNTDFKVVFSFPQEQNNLCTYLIHDYEFHKKCNTCNAEAMKRCLQSKKPEIYKCHAGFTEVVAPIIKNGLIYGYMMFGQITNHENENAVLENIHRLCKEYNITTQDSEFMPKINCKTTEEIIASEKILEALIEYILLKELLLPSEDKLMLKIKQFIEHNLDKNINADMLCREFGIKRTRLYDFFKRNTNCSIAVYIKNAQLAKARELLKNTDIKITEISEMLGFNDYNYFRRVFKQEFGISPKQFREKN